MMLCRIYEDGGPIEMHLKRLSTYCGMREKTFETVLKNLIDLGKLDLKDGMISNARADAEISNRANDLKNNSKAGKASSEKRKQNQQKTSTGVQRAFNHTDTDIYKGNSLHSLPSSADAEKKIAIWLSAAGGKSVGISFDEARGWQKDFPGVDVPQQLRSMRSWLEANPTRRKTERGMRRFVVSWLSKAQDRGGSSGLRSGGRQSVGDSFVDLARDMGILNDGKRDHEPAGLFDAGDTAGNGPVLDLAVTPAEPEDGCGDDFTRRLLHRP